MGENFAQRFVRTQQWQNILWRCINKEQELAITEKYWRIRRLKKLYPVKGSGGWVNEIRNESGGKRIWFETGEIRSVRMSCGHRRSAPKPVCSRQARGKPAPWLTNLLDCLLVSWSREGSFFLLRLLFYISTSALSVSTCAGQEWRVSNGGEQLSGLFISGLR